LALTAQNEDLAKKIKEVKDLVNSEVLKANIFKRKHDENEKAIADLRAKKEKMLQESMKIKTLNESAIPNKSVELNTTNNTNGWLN
jgi:dihydroorotate dehydrogenase